MAAPILPPRLNRPVDVSKVHALRQQRVCSPATLRSETVRLASMLDAQPGAVGSISTTPLRGSLKRKYEAHRENDSRSTAGARCLPPRSTSKTNYTISEDLSGDMAKWKKYSCLMDQSRIPKRPFTRENMPAQSSTSWNALIQQDRENLARISYNPHLKIVDIDQLVDEQYIAESMARRKNGHIPEIADMGCSDPDCDKVFTSESDLAKHEKIHSRPFKCPDKRCKYHSLGLPTQKERDRHVSDKHDPNHLLYPCMFCEFKTKRESNCKQHMEKKHAREYQESKTQALYPGFHALQSRISRLHARPVTRRQ